MLRRKPSKAERELNVVTCWSALTIDDYSIHGYWTTSKLVTYHTQSSVLAVMSVVEGSNHALTKLNRRAPISDHELSGECLIL